MGSQNATAERVAGVNARLDRLPAFGLSPVVFVVVGASYFFTFYDITAIGVTLPVLEERFRLSGADLALPVTTNLFAYIVGAYVLSSLADYIGRRRALALSVVLLSVGAVLTALSWSVTSLAVFRAVTGLGMGAEIALAATIMTELSPPRLRGRGVALNVFWGGVGLAAAPWIGLGLISWLPADIGWRVVFALGALAIVVLIFLNDRWVPESPRWLVLHGRSDRADALLDRMETHVRARGHTLPAPRPAEAEADLTTFPTWELLRPPYLSRVIVVFLFWFFSYMAAYAYLAYLPTLLKAMGVSESLLYSAIGDLGFLVGGLGSVLIIDRWNRKHSAAAAGVVGMVGIALIALSHGPGLLIAGAFLAGIWIMAPALGYAYTSEVFPTRARASGMSIGDGLGHLGGAVQPYIVVAGLAAFGPRGTFGLMIGMIAVAAAIILFGGIRTAGDSLTHLAR
ncbi:MFS transporter [Pseudonocardia kujensis]|uniref:MFS transporter n=1 Tax=Pseudonocardia kujensis TaxID=1128675 RepID=UPI001E65104B|nr:MFS transporter [Pseudonocardia kujensis]MCE0761662.1 MFS transporter [Pseudonocardia kujensis]